MFLHSFNYFRGISILYIVAGHTYWVAHWDINETWERFISNLVSGGTVLFVFISGFLFHHIFYPRFKYSEFIKKKAQNVFIPYLVLISVPIFYWVVIKQSGPAAYYIFSDDSGLWSEYIKPVLLYLWTGTAVPPFWYITFILLTFLLSPLHVRFIQSKFSFQTLTLGILIIISLLLQRPPDNLYPFHALAYFASAYFLGMYCSIYREKIYDLLKGREFYLLIPVIGLALFQALEFPWYSLFAKPAFTWGYPDILYLQKLILCLFFMVFLHRFEHIYIKPLDYMAKASFAIYFLHSFVIEGTGILLHNSGISYSGNIGLWIVFTGFVLVATYMLASTLKNWIGANRSRYIIGW